MAEKKEKFIGAKGESQPAKDQPAFLASQRRVKAQRQRAAKLHAQQDAERAKADEKGA